VLWVRRGRIIVRSAALLVRQIVVLVWTFGMQSLMSFVVLFCVSASLNDNVGVSLSLFSVKPALDIPIVTRVSFPLRVCLLGVQSAFVRLLDFHVVQIVQSRTLYIGKI